MFTSSRLAPPATWSRATETAASNRSSRIRRAKRREPVTLVRSPTTRNADSGRTSGSVPARRSLGEGAGGWRGRVPFTALRTARMWSGVVPQQPPTKLTRPSAASAPSAAAVTSGASS